MGICIVGHNIPKVFRLYTNICFNIVKNIDKEGSENEKDNIGISCSDFNCRVSC